MLLMRRLTSLTALIKAFGSISSVALNYSLQRQHASFNRPDHSKIHYLLITKQFI